VAENEASSYKKNLLSARHLQAHFGNKRISAIEGNQILMRQYINKRKEEIKAKKMKEGEGRDRGDIYLYQQGFGVVEGIV